MLKEQAKLMLSILTEDKKALKDFYRKGYFSYAKDEDYKGKVAIVNESIISFLEEGNNESRVIATVDFQDSGTFIYQLLEDEYSFSQFGEDPTNLTNKARVHFPTKEEVIRDIASIRKYCEKAEEKATAIEKITSIAAKFHSILVQSDNKISSKDAFLLLQNTLARVNQSKELSQIEQDAELDR